MRCRHCHEPFSAHCPECGRCPDQDCPSWCPVNDDIPWLTRKDDTIPVDLETWIHVNTRKF